MTSRICLAGILLCLFSVVSGAQETGVQETGVQETGVQETGVQETPEVFFPPGTEIPPAEAASGGTPPADGAGTPEIPSSGLLPRSYRETSLGMSLEDLKAGLARDALINFRGDRDVSFLPSREQSLVESTGFSFVRRVFFQLRDGKVFIMAYALNTQLVDHYSVFTTFTEKYGEPVYLDPKQAIWESEDTRIAVERPLTVKYIDKTIFNDIINESSLIESAEVRRRQEFLDDF
jgi:hypothetical protein